MPSTKTYSQFLSEEVSFINFLQLNYLDEYNIIFCYIKVTDLINELTNFYISSFKDHNINTSDDTVIHFLLRFLHFLFSLQVFSNVFKESQHVGHFAKYREDYKAHVMAFLHHIGMLQSAGIDID